MDMTLIMEPDDLGAWLGLAGVVVGFMLSAGGTAVQSRRKDRRGREATLLFRLVKGSFR
jgi:hypothetical protein